MGEEKEAILCGGGSHFCTSGCLISKFSLNLLEPWLPKSVKDDSVSHVIGLVMIRKFILKCFVNCEIQ